MGVSCFLFVRFFDIYLVLFDSTVAMVTNLDDLVDCGIILSAF